MKILPSFFSIFDSLKKKKWGVHFQLFSDPLKMKIWVSPCHFKLVNGCETSCAQYKFTPFSGWEAQMYEKGPCGVFFYVHFSNSLNMKRILSYTFVGLVKLLNNIGFVTMTNMSFSFLRLIKIIRLDSLEG